MIKSHRLLLSLSLACLVSLPTFAEAPVVDDSDNFAILDDQQVALEQPADRTRLEELDNEEEIPLARDLPHSGKAHLADKMKGLQQELQELRGQLETQAHNLKILQQQQLAFYKDLDARLASESKSTSQTVEINSPQVPKNLPLAAPKPTSTPSRENLLKTSQSTVIISGKNVARSNPVDEQVSYLAAYELVKNKHFDEALTAMQAFVNQYPQGGYTANAQYWLGELYLVKNNYYKAIEHFDLVLRQFPSSSKAAASTLKIGYALAASGKTNDARIRLQQVLKNYPDTPTAQLAMTKLESLGVS